MLTPQFTIPLHNELVVDLFAGGGGASTGIEKAIGRPVDIGLRMLTPRELFTAQGFDSSYQIDFGADGAPMTKTAQVRMCGNSVCPPLSQALVGSNYSEIAIKRKAA